MESSFTRQHILRATQGRLVNAREDEHTLIQPTQICTDTREINPGQLFLALRGPRYDGNDFLEQAHHKGACGAIATRFPLPLPDGFFVIQVRDSLRALQAIASCHRATITAPIIAVTGSNGKTTVKELIGQALRQQLRSYSSAGNLNNQIGVPLSLLQVTSEHCAAVLELGTNQPGEIELLAQLVKPRIGVITNVHRAHLAGLGAIDQVAREKASLVDVLNTDENNILVLNADDNWFDYFRQRSCCQILSFAINNQAEVTATDIHTTSTGLEFDIRATGHEPIPVRFPYPGLFNVYNVLAAVTACIGLGIKPTCVAASLYGYKAPPLRYHIQTCGSYRVLEDCYNANPDSVQAALLALETLGTGRKIAILGDMGELGPTAASLHEDVGRFAASIGIDAVFACGQFSTRVACGAKAAGLSNAFSFTNKAQLVQSLASFLTGTESLLIKGSRTAKMEEVLGMLREHIQ